MRPQTLTVTPYAICPRIEENVAPNRILIGAVEERKRLN